jgi:hypothetical protein
VICFSLYCFALHNSVDDTIIQSPHNQLLPGCPRVLLPTTVWCGAVVCGRACLLGRAFLAGVS